MSKLNRSAGTRKLGPEAPASDKRKTAQARILVYAQEIGWRFVSRAEAEKRRGFGPDGATPEDRVRPVLFLDSVI